MSTRDISDTSRTKDRAETVAHSFLIFGIAPRRTWDPGVYRGVCLREYTIPLPRCRAGAKTGANKRAAPPLFARLLDGPTSWHFNNAAIAKFTIILLRRHLHAPHKSSPILSSFAPSPSDLPSAERRNAPRLGRAPWSYLHGNRYLLRK